jgi:hypothetical protein
VIPVIFAGVPLLLLIRYVTSLHVIPNLIHYKELAAENEHADLSAALPFVNFVIHGGSEWAI